ncbi:MAG: hypothetical protein FWE89_05990, partial [Syntrophaceae bacterium]|nr:hypothetical protein [Syntrophaceae bacterium]
DVRVIDPRLKDPGVCTGLVIRSISRKGKYVRMVLQGEDGLRKGIGERTGALEVLFHLRMTGRLFWLTEETPLPAYTRTVFSFDAGKLLLIDPRRFATFAARPLVEGDTSAVDPPGGDERGSTAQAGWCTPPFGKGLSHGPAFCCWDREYLRL